MGQVTQLTCNRCHRVLRFGVPECETCGNPIHPINWRQGMSELSDTPTYGPAYPRWAAEHEQDVTRRDLARELLTAEARIVALETERNALLRACELATRAIDEVSLQLREVHRHAV